MACVEVMFLEGKGAYTDKQKRSCILSNKQKKMIKGVFLFLNYSCGVELVILLIPFIDPF